MFTFVTYRKYALCIALCVSQYVSYRGFSVSTQPYMYIGSNVCNMHAHLGRYLERQGHSMTLKQKRVRPITLLFEVGF